MPFLEVKIVMGTDFYLKNLFRISVQSDLSVVVHNRPSIKFDKKTGLTIISYDGPEDFGIQTFSFDPDVFSFCYNEAKYKHDKSKFDYIPFEDSFFKNFYPKANDAVKFIFGFFSITPTVIEKAKHLNYKKHRFVPLQVKRSKLFSYLNLQVKISSLNEQNSSRKISVDIQEVDRLNQNMSLAVEKAATTFDFSFFDIYLDNYIELRKLFGKSPYINPKALNKLKLSFSKMVDNFQKKLYNTLDD